MSYMPPFPPDGSEDAPARDDHGWIVSHMIGLIGYCEAEGLSEAERTLTEATERLAPLLNGHRLKQLREARLKVRLPIDVARQAVPVLRMPSAPGGGLDARHVSA